MSDTAKRRSASERSVQRRKAAQRAGKRTSPAKSAREAAPTESVLPPPAAVVATAAAVPGLRSRRSSVGALARPVLLSRDMELAYIRADMRRLLIIAGALLVLMLVILVVVER